MSWVAAQQDSCRFVAVKSHSFDHCFVKHDLEEALCKSLLWSFILQLPLFIPTPFLIPPSGEYISTAEFLSSSSEDDWEVANQVVPTEKIPEKIRVTESICTSWQVCVQDDVYVQV